MQLFIEISETIGIKTKSVCQVHDSRLHCVRKIKKEVAMKDHYIFTHMVAM